MPGNSGHAALAAKNPIVFEITSVSVLIKVVSQCPLVDKYGLFVPFDSKSRNFFRNILEKMSLP